MNIATNAYLFFAGITLTVVGAYIGLTPSEYLSQLNFQTNISAAAMSEMRGMGGTLLVCGLFSFMTIFKKQMASSALIICLLVFSSFSIFRCLGIVVDGLPNQGILIALSLEAVFAFLGWTLWFKRRFREVTRH
ncbi:MAG: DUF4345 domain-containing protein [Paraglaciecola sp.]|uniref:DUF4345 domain-containing protein n=1 Tax=Paraglaciecola sp. TaxID=1920173 RepID=UPI003299DD8D